MKYVKMLGLAAVAAAALMAFVGASSASATVLCKTPGTGSPTGTTCPEGWAYGANTTVHAILEEGQHATLTDGEGNKVVTCKESTVHGKTTNEGSATETVKGHIEVLTFGNCTSPFLGETKCTVTTVAPGSLEIHWIEGTHNGTLTSTGAEITTSCASIFGTIHCIYVTNNTHIGTVTGGQTATMKAESANIAQKATSGLCPAQAKWDAAYNITEPDVLYVTGHT